MRELIAECSTNHGGRLALCQEFIETFAPWVDTMKFQLTRVAHLRPQDPQYEWFKRSELTLDQWAEVKRLCGAAKVGFLLTVYNAADIWELQTLGCGRVKIGSGEAREAGLAAAVIRAKLKPIVSCGLARPYAIWGYHARFLGCVPRYPAPLGIAAAKLLTMPELAGWSDHAAGLYEMQAAWAVGAQIIETHVRIPRQARPSRVFEKTREDLEQFRLFTQENPERFISRWQE